MDVVILDNDILVTIVDENNIFATVIPNNITGQAALLFQDEGVDLGTQGTVTKLNFVGAGIVASRSGSTVTITVSSSGGGGSGDVVGPTGATADDIATYSGATGKIIKDSGSKISDLQATSGKDASTGYVGLTLLKINFKNVLNTFISFFTNSNTAARTYTFQDRDGTIADLFNDRTKGTTNNRYISTAELTTQPSTGALVANRMFLQPWIVRNTISIDKLVQEITTGTSGKHRFGIYNDDGNGYPGTLVVDSGEFTISAPAVLTATISKTLLPGLYWIATFSDTANTLRTIANTNYWGTVGFASTIGASQDNGWFKDLTYTSLPDPFGASGALSRFAFTLTCYRIT